MEKKSKKVMFIIVACLLLLLFLKFPGVSSFEKALCDLKISFYKLIKLQNIPISSNLALVEINSNTLKKHNDNIGYYDAYQILKRASNLRAKAVVFLIPPKGNSKCNYGKSQFINQMSHTPVFLTSHLNIDSTQKDSIQFLVPKYDLIKRAKGEGIVFPLKVDNEGVLRKKKLSILRKNQMYPSIEVRVASFIENLPISQVINQRRSIYIKKKKIPIDNESNTLFIPINDRFFKKYTFDDMLNKKKKVYIKNKILVVGSTTGKSPFVKVPGISREDKSNIYVTSSMIYAINNGLTITQIPQWMNILFLFVIIFIVGYMIPLFDAGKLILITAYFTGGLILLNIAIFLLGYNMAIVPVIFATWVFTVSLLTYRYNKMRDLSSRFVPSKLIKVLQDGDPESDLKTVVRKAVILFTDIKGYTTLSERHSPAIVMGMLKEYMGIMNDIIEKNGGVILNYQGDSLMAVFGLDDISEREAARQSVVSAQEMQKSTEKLRHRWQMECRELFITGTGICAGDIAVGMLGGKLFRQYTAIGDAVNEAARLQVLAKSMRIPALINDKVYMLINDLLPCTPIRPARLRGKYQLSRVYRIDKPIKKDKILEFASEMNGYETRALKPRNYRILKAASDNK